jgi:hypothetical protein
MYLCYIDWEVSVRVWKMRQSNATLMDNWGTRPTQLRYRTLHRKYYNKDSCFPTVSELRRTLLTVVRSPVNSMVLVLEGLASPSCVTELNINYRWPKVITGQSRSRQLLALFPKVRLTPPFVRSPWEHFMMWHGLLCDCFWLIRQKLEYDKLFPRLQVDMGKDWQNKKRMVCSTSLFCFRRTDPKIAVFLPLYMVTNRGNRNCHNLTIVKI